MPEDMLEYYAAPGPFTELGAFAAEVEALPDDVGALAHAVQMVLIHRFWAQAYNVEVTPERDKEQGLHSAEAMLARAKRLAPAAIGQVRPPDKRVVGNCRHFSTMLCAFFRQKGVPARARCGFSSYFEAGKFVDHWVCEYWNVGESRWVQVDAQLDSFQQAAVKADFDPLDTPRDRFLVAGDVWLKIQRGEIDPARCGIADMWGAWFVRGDLALDVASLQKVELLPWEPFGMQGIAPPGTEAPPETAELMALVDRAAALSARGDDASINELLSLAERDGRLRPPESTIQAARVADATGPTAGNPLAAS
jgi:hypothetical protein